MAIQKILKEGFAKIFAGGKADAGDEKTDFSKIDVLHIAKGVGTAALTFILGSSGAVFSSYPFGIAFLSSTDRFVPYSYLGLIVSSVVCRGYSLASAVVYTVIIMLRYALSQLSKRKHSLTPTKEKGVFARITALVSDFSGEDAFSEPILMRCAVSCFAALVFGLYRLIGGGFLYYDLFGLLAGFLICPLLALVLAPMFTRDGEYSRFFELSTAALMFVTVFSLREASIFGFSLSFVAALFITLWAASGLGALKGCAAGLFAGIACGGVNAFGALEAAYSIGAAPCIMAAVGLVAGALWHLSRAAAAASAAVIGITLGLAIEGYTVLPSLLSDTVAAMALFLPLSRLSILPRIPVFVHPKNRGEAENIIITQKKQADTAQRMNSLSEAFAHLSDTLYALSDRMRRPAVVDLKHMSDKVFDGFCSKCSMAHHCLERELLTTLDAQSKLTAALYKNGRVEMSDVPAFLRERCFNISAVVDELNRSAARLIEKLYKNDKVEAFALDYEAMSKLLSEQITANEEEYKPDASLTAALKRSLKYMNINTPRVICYGSRKKHIFISGLDLGRMRIGAQEIKTSIENTVGTRLDVPRFNIEEDDVTMTLTSCRRFSVETSKATNIKASESANGDTASIFEGRDDYCYALISDGMGSGKEAAVTSKICSVFIERMLTGGNRTALTLEMLNGFIRNRGSECSATVDLAEIDLITGEACFIKSGAAPSFVMRDGNLYKLESKTVPIGIMRELDAEQIKFELAGGDVIIMLSDGVAQSLEDGIWLANLLTYEWDDNLDTMAEKILDNAVFANNRSDDMTVVMVRVRETEEE